MSKKFLIAIYPDDYTQPGKPPESDAASPRWAELLQAAGHEVRWVDVRRADILEQLAGCDGFMWRWAHFGGMSRIARRLLPVLENELHLCIYPNQKTCWHYDDKIAQAYLLDAAGIPSPKTWVWFDEAATIVWAQNEATYPIVLKLTSGAASSNVKLIRSADEAVEWITRLFRIVGRDLTEIRPTALPPLRYLKEIARIAIKRTTRSMMDNGYEPQTGYALFQEFLPDNGWDTRVTVIGNRAFGFRRFNRENDFRASGSGNIDWNPEAVDKAFIHAAFAMNEKLGTQSCAIDGLYRKGEPVIAEISYTYVSEAIYKCPGHWRRVSGGELEWVAGQQWPEQGQIEDFLTRLGGGK